MGKTLPNNWVETELGCIGYIETGNTPSKNIQSYYGSDIPWAKPGDINKAAILFETEEHLSIEGSKKARILPAGSIMVTCIGNLGNVAIAGLDMATNQQINSIVIKHHFVNNKYVYYYALTLKGWLIENSTSTTISMVNKSNFEKAPILLPPLPEQERIANKLDALFAQLDGIRTTMERIPTLLKNFRQQVLTQAVTGKLTEEWREGKELDNEFIKYQLHEYRDYNNKLPSKWVVLSFQDVVEVASNLVNPDDYLDYPLIAPDNIESMTGRLISTPSVAEIAPISPKHYFNAGSIIYSKIRPYLSKVTYVDFEGLCSADMYPLKTKLDVFYLYYYMLSTTFLSYATTAGERSVLPKINQKGLNIIPIPVPSLPEQQEIVRRVESLFTQADAIEQQYISLKQKIDNLPQAILHKAFKGELVEQLPTDGDARDLLRQIEELKESTKKKK